MAHRQPDRCASYHWLPDDTLALLEARLGVDGEDEVEAALGIDRWRNVGAAPPPTTPDQERRIREFVPQQFRNRDDAEVTAQGRVLKKHPEADYLEDVLYSPLQELEDVAALDDYPFPDPASIVADDELVTLVQNLKATDAVVLAMVTQPFKGAWYLRGFENFLCDFLVNPQFAEHLYDRLYATATAQCVAGAKAGADMVQIVGDIAMQDRLMMAPDTWRRFDRPRLNAMIEVVRAAVPDVRIGMHSDGKVTDIVPDLIAAGIEILNPIQPECMDPLDVKRQWGDRLVLHGCVSIQRTIPFGSPADVKREIHELIDGCGRDGGLIIGPSNVLMKEFPLDNIIAMYEAVTEHAGTP